MSSKFKTAKSEHLALCLVCHQLNQAQHGHCSRCGGEVYVRQPRSYERTLAWLVTSIILYIPANIYPIMSTVAFTRVEPNTIVGGVIELWQQESYIIAMVIFLASIVIPIAKILVLIWLCFSLKLGLKTHKKERTVIYKYTELIGRWSMIDIFVVAILVALLQLGGFMVVEPGIAALSFAAVVITTMLAAEAFDPRLIWDVKNEPTKVNSPDVME
ncbi:paraquat-inducible protein A [Catenovulum adriaticum]|uniref:Paraquat-inducible protein A n=1 Tax=Catenovulum adriaticum TaxID=2984846 RepID=A0ABY7APW3_9ALTE|nr:paraquat-inducible protein A [Catenovulum sp. TS8]WAJ70782.1 paraquat-inducible protein A [Catenovulum sp. TS8]